MSFQIMFYLLFNFFPFLLLSVRNECVKLRISPALRVLHSLRELRVSRTFVLFTRCVPYVLYVFLKGEQK